MSSTDLFGFLLFFYDMRQDNFDWELLYDLTYGDVHVLSLFHVENKSKDQSP
jgi:hypothetical protein